MSITSKALTILAVLAASPLSLGACAAGSSEDPTTTESATEPTLFSGQSAPPSDRGPRIADDRGDTARALGATARAITYNHPQPHELVVPLVEIQERRGGTYTMTAGGGALSELHTHDVHLTPQQLSEIADGAEITVESTPGGLRGGHTHFVTIVRR